MNKNWTEFAKKAVPHLSKDRTGQRENRDHTKKRGEKRMNREEFEKFLKEIIPHLEAIEEAARKTKMTKEGSVMLLVGRDKTTVTMWDGEAEDKKPFDCTSRGDGEFEIWNGVMEETTKIPRTRKREEDGGVDQKREDAERAGKRADGKGGAEMEEMACPCGRCK